MVRSTVWKVLTESWGPGELMEGCQGAHLNEHQLTFFGRWGKALNLQMSL